MTFNQIFVLVGSIGYLLLFETFVNFCSALPTCGGVVLRLQPHVDELVHEADVDGRPLAQGLREVPRELGVVLLAPRHLNTGSISRE